MIQNFKEFRHSPDNIIYISSYTLSFNGSGSNDLSISGYLVDVLNFKIQIDGSSSPNTFKWSADGGLTWIATNIPITTGNQLLSNGINIRFSSTTGHNISDYWTLIGSMSSFPLTWFQTQVPSYLLPITPVNIIWQWYKQGEFRKLYDGTNEYSLPIPWSDGDLYILNKNSYDIAYYDYLNPIPTLAEAKQIKFNQLESYYNSKLLGKVTYSGFTYDSSLIKLSRLTIASDYFTRVGSILPNSYTRDINEISRTINLTDLSNIIKVIDQIHYYNRLARDLHYDAINALLTVNDVNNYDFTVAYWTPTPLEASLTFLANYTSLINSINADYAIGIKTGTATGGASILSNYLNLAFNDIRFVDYVATFNANSPQIGTIKFTLNTNYSGIPTSVQNLVQISQTNNSDINLISLSHNTSGQIALTIKGASAFIINNVVNTWSPTINTDYLFELHYDITAGNTYIKINNVILGSIITSTGTRNNDINLLRIGSTYLSTPTTSNFKIKNLQINNK